MKHFLAPVLFACLFYCSAGNISLENWKFVSKNPGGKAALENGRLVINTGKKRWSLRNNNRNTAVPGKAVKLTLEFEVLPPANAMLFARLYSVKDNKCAPKEFHTMKMADTIGFTRKYSQTVNIPDGVTEFELELAGFPQNAFAISSINSSIVPALPEIKAPAKGKYNPVPQPAGKRYSEKLDRGLTAFESGKGTYLSWRLLKSDAPDIAFDIYRDGKKINTAPVSATTDFYDNCQGKTYMVKPVNSDAVSGKADFEKLTPGSISPCRIFKLDDKKARVSKVGIGDLDGDGVYDYVVKYAPANVDPWYTAYFPSEGTNKLEALNGRTGKVMWKKDLGWSIETGVWYSPYIVYDFDGDGKAEVAVKTGVGDPRDHDGKVTSGEEYLTVFDGKTGKVVAQAPWPPRDEFRNYDISYHLYARNQMAVAYLDGKTPYIIALRGTYNLMLAEAWKLADGKLTNVWKYSSAGRETKYQGQGAHATRCADIDGDSRDEVILGNMVLDDDGQPLWSNARRHPDFLFVGDLIPQREGLEVATCLEIDNTKGGLNVSDAGTGACVWELKESTFHVHYGFCGDIDPIYRGVLIGGTDKGAGTKKYPANAWIFTSDGKMLSRGRKTQFFGDSPWFAYWDGDLRREHIKPLMRKYNGGEVGGGWNGVVITIADVYGDWREEIICSAEGELRIYSTDIPAMDRRPSLMQDHFYRMATATESCGYHYDAIPQILPSSVATDVVLTLKKSMLQITVTAPMQNGVDGTLSLELPDYIKGDFNKADIKLEKGGIWNKTVKLSGVDPAKPDKIYAVLKLSNGKTLTARTLSGKQTVKVPEAKLKGYWSEAENMKFQKGGKAIIRKWNGATRNKAITNWLKPGHKIGWQIPIKRDGKYKIIFRYATKRNNVRRQLEINGKNYGTLRFFPTGAMGANYLDWREFSPDITLDLKKGMQNISLNCISGALSLDGISLIPVQ